jgi:hypothetical protein
VPILQANSSLEVDRGLVLVGRFTPKSTAVLFTIMSQFIARRLRTKSGYQSEALANQAPRSVPSDPFLS